VVVSVLEYDRLMAGSYRGHALIEAPIEDVWPIVSDPRTHPDWWPEVTEVRASRELTEGEEYQRVSRRLGFLDQVDGIWVVERLEHLKEAHFRCTVSGAYTRFALTPARDQTFVEIEAGMLPHNLRWRLAKTMSRLYFVRWLREVLDALPRVVRASTKSGPESPSRT
jgi:Polyketide cyclase / dehydrase and lipid transport